MKFYKRDPDRALAGMAELTLKQRGAYNSLLDLLYSRDGQVPDDDRRVAKMISCHWREWMAVKPELIAAGKIWVEGGILRAKRVQETIKEASDFAQDQSKRASKGWQKRKNDNENNDADMPPGNALTATATPTAIDNNSVPKGTDAGASDLFGNQGEEGTPKPKSMKAMLWGQAKVILAEANVTNGNAASFLGKLARDYGDDIFLPALVAMDREKPGDPVAWLTAACQSRSEGVGGKSAMPEGFAMSSAFSAHSRRLFPGANPKEMFAAFKADAKSRGLKFADWEEAAQAFVSNRALPRGSAR